MSYVKVDAVAEYTGYCRETIWKYTRIDPNFPVKNIGTKDRPQYRYVLTDVINYLEEKRNGKA